MCFIRLAGGDERASPVVPFPHQFRISRERIGCREFLGAMVFPQPVFASESWDAARGGDAGAGNDSDGSGSVEAGGEALGVLCKHALIVCCQSFGEPSRYSVRGA